MKHLLVSGLLVVSSSGVHAASLRCDDGIASQGDRTIEVLHKCGEPVSRAVTGYTFDERGNREFQQEEWVYGPKGGMLYFLQFEGERLKKIDSKRGG